MFIPKRIRRSRKRGWRMPKNTIYVGRPTKFGNPYYVNPVMRLGDPDPLYAVFGPEGRQIGQAYYDQKDAAQYAVELFAEMVNGEDFSEIQGKNLACWCVCGEPCHADVLLKLANQGK